MQLTIVTTAGRPDETTERLAHYAASLLQYDYIPRKKRSVLKMQETYQANVIVAGKQRYEYFPYGQAEPFFFHPNSAAYRIKRLASGEADPFVDVCQLQEGSTIIDCTLGIGSDSLVAAYVVGTSGQVIGIEANRNVAFIVKEGMKSYDTQELPLTICMRDIVVHQGEAIDYLKMQPSNSVDVVYMDPMFDKVIEEASNFESLRASGEHSPLTEEWVEEAKRVARNCVVLKAHYESPYFEQFGFQQLKRQTSKFHYGIIKI